MAKQKSGPRQTGLSSFVRCKNAECVGGDARSAIKAVVAGHRHQIATWPSPPPAVVDRDASTRRHCCRAGQLTWIVKVTLTLSGVPIAKWMTWVPLDSRLSSNPEPYPAACAVGAATQGELHNPSLTTFGT